MRYPKYRLTLVKRDGSRSVTQLARVFDGYGITSDGSWLLASTAKTMARIASSRWLLEFKLRPFGKWHRLGGDA